MDKQGFQQTSTDADPMELSPRLKYIQGQDGLVIVKFPKPTLLYSLKEKEGFRLYMHDYQLVSYLQNLIQKSIPLDPIPVERIISDANERDRRFTKVCPFSFSFSLLHKLIHPSLFPQFSAEWCDSFLRYLLLLMKRSPESTWELLDCYTHDLIEAIKSRVDNTTKRRSFSFLSASTILLQK